MKDTAHSDFKGAKGVSLNGLLNEKNKEYNGKPFKGDAYLVSKDNLPVQKQKVKIQIFSLDNEQDLKEYQDVCQKVGDGVAVISSEEKKYSEDIKSWRVFLRWIEYYYVAPKDRLDLEPK